MMDKDPHSADIQQTTQNEKRREVRSNGFDTWKNRATKRKIGVCWVSIILYIWISLLM